MGQIIIYISPEIENKIKELKNIVKLSKSDVIQKILEESFKEDINTLTQLFKNKEEVN